MILATMLLSVAGLGLQDIPQQKLAPGQCVTMLWTKAQPPLRIAMLDERSRTLLIRRNRHDVALPAAGAQRYASGDLTIGVDLNFRDGAAVTDGAIVDTGVIAITATSGDTPGETLMLPVGGVRACR